MPRGGVPHAMPTNTGWLQKLQGAVLWLNAGAFPANRQLPTVDSQPMTS